jgi:hypothetical protein
MCVSVAALVVAAGGGAYAATTQITGAQIKNGTVSKADLKPALRKQISLRPRRGLRGPQGIQGPQGPAGLPGANGAAGAIGARGPSDAYIASTTKFTFGSATLSLTLPPGDYVVYGRGEAENGGNVNASTVAGVGQCLLTAAADTAHNDQSFGTVPVDGAPVAGPPGHGGSVLLTNVTTFHLPAGGTVVEECKDGNNTSATNMLYGALKIVAIQVVALH